MLIPAEPAVAASRSPAAVRTTPGSPLRTA